MLKESEYNFSHEMQDGRILLFNAFSSAIVILNKEEYLMFKNYSNLKNQSLLNLFTNNGYLIDATEEELEKIITLRAIKYLSTTNIGAYQILPTTNCNAKCYYCYENGYCGKTMTKETVKETCHYICENSKNDKQINITWYGGEPFLEFAIIQEICATIKAFCEKNNIKFSTSAITNGYLLNKDIIAFMREHNFDRIQITIDGNEISYNNYKRINDDNAFYKVIENIDCLLQNKINVIVRMNLDKNNFLYVVDFVHWCKKRFGNNPYLKLYPANIYFKRSKKPECIIEPCDIVNYFRPIYEALVECDFMTNIEDCNISYTDSTCSAVYINTVTIAPDGKLYKCQHYVDNEDCSIGTVSRGGVFNNEYAKWMRHQLPQMCEECKFLPMCQGGCVACEQLDFTSGRCTPKKYLLPLLFEVMEKIIKKGDKYASN